MAVRVAVLADSSLQRHVLQQALSTQGYRIAMNNDPRQLLVADVAGCQTDIWLVNLLQADAGDCQVLEYLYESQTPVLFGEGQAPERHSEDYPRWERSLLAKLDKLLGGRRSAVVCEDPLLNGAQGNSRLLVPEALNQQLPVTRHAEEVWLLAASMGGPVAVKEFLDALPGNLPVGFIYAQHIDAGFEDSLPQAVGRHSEWRVRLAQNNAYVGCGEVVVVPVRNELGFSEAGQLRVLPNPWQGLYSPCINQVMVNLTRCFAQRSGVIVFSGMGDDGSLASEYAHEQGARIWVQSAQSCACPSMPDSVRKTGFSSYSSSPRGLAIAMLNHLINRHAADSIRIS